MLASVADSQVLLLLLPGLLLMEPRFGPSARSCIKQQSGVT